MFAINHAATALLFKRRYATLSGGTLTETTVWTMVTVLLVLLAMGFRAAAFVLGSQW